MADNISVTQGAGTILRTTDNGGVHTPHHLEEATQRAALLTVLGAVDETAPASDTASSGASGRLQRIAQRITSLMALIGEVQASPTANTLLDRLKTIAAAVAGATPAGENHIGQVGTPGDVISVDLTLDTNPYADGDVLADFQAVSNFVRVNGGRALIQSVTVLDKDDQGVAFDILSAPTGVSLGSENAAPTISDANAADVQRVLRVETTDYIDLGGCKVATKTNVGLVVEADAASRDIYIGAIIRGAATYGATGIRLRFGLIWF